MQSNSRSFVAGEDLGPSLFVGISGDHQVSLSGEDGDVYGVTHEGTREAPIPGVTPLHAAAGESTMIYGPNENCEVLAGEEIDAGDYLKSDANSKAVVAGPGDHYYAQAVNSVTAANQKVKITLVRGFLPSP